MDWLPLPALILAVNGAAVAANRAWAALSVASAAAMRGDGWLDLIEPADRDELLASLRAAAECARAGFADCRFVGRQGPAMGRLWWRPGPPGHLVVCAAELGSATLARAVDPTSADSLDWVAHQIFGVALALQSLVGMTSEPVTQQLRDAVDELDDLIRAVRGVTFELQEPRLIADLGVMA